jgi:hypothetical protein
MSMNITPRMYVSLPVEEGSDVVDRQPHRLAVRRIGGGAAGGFQPVREMFGSLFGRDVLDSHLGEVLVINVDGMDAASMAATLGHDDPFRVGTHRSVLITAPGDERMR